MNVALCLLTWNEIEGCRYDVPRLKFDAFDEVFAIDNGSTDGTVEYLESQGIIVYQQDIPTYNGAYFCAFRHCKSDALVLFHPKGSIDPDETLKFRSYFEQGYDLVVASRIISGAVNEEDAKLFRPRKWFVMCLGLVSRLLWMREGNMVWDVLHGFRGIQKEAFFAMGLLSRGVTIDLETVVQAYRKRLPRIEFLVAERTRLSGSTNFRAWPTGRKMLEYILSELFRKNHLPLA